MQTLLKETSTSSSKGKEKSYSTVHRHKGRGYRYHKGRVIYKGGIVGMSGEGGGGQSIGDAISFMQRSQPIILIPSKVHVIIL